MLLVLKLTKIPARGLVELVNATVFAKPFKLVKTMLVVPAEP